jgi:hypothetical protein
MNEGCPRRPAVDGADDDSQNGECRESRSALLEGRILKRVRRGLLHQTIAWPRAQNGHSRRLSNGHLNYPSGTRGSIVRLRLPQKLTRGSLDLFVQPSIVQMVCQKAEPY